jgi:hypothetical protein
VLWGFGRFFVYTLLAGVIGALAAFAAWCIVELLLYLLYESVQLGFVSSCPWIDYRGFGRAIFATERAGLATGVSYLLVILLTAVRAITVAYVFSLFFTANTVIFFLLRKHVENVDVDEIYSEEEEEAGLFVPETLTEETAEEVEAETQAAEPKDESEDADQEAAEDEPGVGDVEASGEGQQEPDVEGEEDEIGPAPEEMSEDEEGEQERE